MKGRFFSVIFLVVLIFSLAGFVPVVPVPASEASDLDWRSGGEGGSDRFFEEVPEKTESKDVKKTWTHPERWSDADSAVQIIVRPEDISMKSYTIYFKGARPGDTITFTNPGNCLIGDANIIEFDEDRKALVTILPRNHDSEMFFLSGLFRTKGEHIPFSIVWKPWATAVRYITGADIFQE